MRLALLVLAALAALPASRAQPVFERLTRAEGLPSDYVLAIYQDRWGFIWFGTDAGAVRWDGRHARTFGVDDGLPHPYVTGFAETADGAFWATTNGGLARWTGEVWETVETPTGTYAIGQLGVDREGRLVIASAFVVARREGESWRVWRPSVALGIPGAPIHDIGNGRLLLSGFEAPFRALVLAPDGADGFDPSWLPLDGLEDARATFAVFRVGRQLVGLTSALESQVFGLRLGEGGLTRVSDPAPLPIIAHLAGRDGALYGFGRSGLVSVDLATGAASPNLLDVHVTSAAFDREGGLWVGTFGEGAARLVSMHLTTLSDLPALRLAASPDGTLWATGDRIARIMLDSDTPTVDLRETHPARAVSVLPDGRVRFSVTAHVREAIAPDAPLSSARRVTGDAGWISGLTETADTLWVGSYGNGVRRFLKTEDGVTEVDTLGTASGLPTTTVEDVVRTSAGTWAITRAGAALLRGDRFQTLARNDGLPSSSVHAIYEARDGAHWFGTDRGVGRLAEGARRADTIGGDAMSGVPVVAFFERSAEPDAVYAVNERALWRIEGGEAHLVDGFPLVPDARQSVEHALYHASSDRLVLATSGGVVVADLAALVASAPIAPPVALVGATVDDRPVALVGSPREARLEDLAPGRHRVVIEASALRFGGESRMEWREADGPWREAADGRITLPDVGAGDHTIEVRAVTPGDVVSEETARLAFTVRPRWWERGLVQALLALLGLASLVGGVRFASQRRLRARVRELEMAERLRAERERISRDLHDHVGAEVAAILTEAEIARLEASTEGRDADALREVEQRARRTMGSLREAIWALGHGALTPAALAERLGQFAETQARGTTLVVEIAAHGETDRPLSPTQALALYRIGQEAVRNAVRHSGGSRLSVSVEANRQRVAVVVRDDGAFGGPAGDGGGYGMSNMQARAEALGGTFAVTNGDGTTARAEIPLT